MMSHGSEISLPTGRRLVIPDIHGCTITLNALLRQVNLSPSDQVFFLGDYVSKGPDSLGVIKTIIDLSQKGHQVHAVLGNHDFLLLQYLESKDGALGQKLQELNGDEFLTQQVPEFEKQLSFFKHLAPYHVSGEFILVHAGFDFSLPDPYSDLHSMLTIRDFQYDSEKADGKTIVHGHYPHPLKWIQAAIENKSNVIPLDNGCVYQNREDQGNLICLNLDTFKIWVQPNIESQKTSY